MMFPKLYIFVTKNSVQIFNILMIWWKSRIKDGWRLCKVCFMNCFIRSWGVGLADKINICWLWNEWLAGSFQSAVKSQLHCRRPDIIFRANQMMMADFIPSRTSMNQMGILSTHISWSPNDSFPGYSEIMQIKWRQPQTESILNVSVML